MGTHCCFGCALCDVTIRHCCLFLATHPFSETTHGRLVYVFFKARRQNDKTSVLAGSRNKVLFLWEAVNRGLHVLRRLLGFLGGLVIVGALLETGVRCKDVKMGDNMTSLYSKVCPLIR